MAETTFNGRRAVSIENDDLRVTVLPGGVHSGLIRLALS
jgi:hypothetical protein